MFTISVFRSDARRPQIFTPEMFVFAGGESQVKLPAEFLAAVSQPSDLLGRGDYDIASIRISALLKTADAVMQLLLLTDAIRRVIPAGAPVELDMPYVPYARQDRVCNEGEALSAKVFCTLINAQGYASVRITDPHSDVVSALLDRVTVLDAARLVAKVLKNEAFKNGVALIAPDAGARKRVITIAKKVGVGTVGFADKIRDTKTGAISGTTFPQLPDDQPALVVDDICDGGRTFIELAKAAKEAGFSNKLYLYITHGIFSRGVEALTDYYDGVFTAYDWTNSDNAGLTVVN